MHSKTIIQYAYHTLHSVDHYVEFDEKNDEASLDFNNPQFILHLPLLIKTVNENLDLKLGSQILLLPLVYRTEDFYHGKKKFHDLLIPFAIPMKKVLKQDEEVWQVTDWPFIPRQHYTLTDNPITADDKEKLIFWKYSQIGEIIKQVEPFYRVQKNEEKLNLDWAFYTKELLQLIVQSLPEPLKQNRLKTGGSYIEVTNIPSTAKYLNQLLKDNGEYPLIQKFFNIQEKKKLLSCYSEEGMLTHTGQMTLNTTNPQQPANAKNWFGLAENQRIALSQIEKNSNQILCVNGPPGTGKTTLLQSFLATMLVNHTLSDNRREWQSFNQNKVFFHKPLLLFGTSHTNQAVTNIINAFKINTNPNRNLWEKRWLKEELPYGCYYSNNSNKNCYTFDDVYSLITDPNFFLDSKKIWTENAQAYLNETTKNISILLEKLSQQIQKEQQEYVKFCELAQNYNESESSLVKEQFNKLHSFIETNKNIKKEFHRVRVEFEAKNIIYDNEQKFWNQLLFKLNLKEATVSPEFIFFTKKQIDEMKVKIQQLDKNLNLYKKIENQYKNIAQLEELTSGKINDSGIFSYIDNTHRYKLFQLCLRYWEGIYLQFFENFYLKLEQNNGFSPSFSYKTNRYHLVSMLCPCSVVTLHSIGKYFYSMSKTKDYVNYQEIDWLIVDEAGQLNPEKIVFPLSLSKNVLLVGDDLQIKPIINLPEYIDKDNLLASGFDNSIFDYNFSHSNPLNSVIKIAQNSCSHHQYASLSPGLYLLEHRRCPEQIISYCNEAFYQGLLIPKNPNKTSDELTLGTHWGYISVNGKTEKIGDSKINREEIIAILKYLHKNKNKFKNKDISQYFAFLTPFKEQQNYFKNYVSEYMDSAKISKDDAIFFRKIKSCVTGTVHALQGSEIPVVFFMLTDSEGSTFIDNDPSILNVAVSRAKESFIVVGNLAALQGKYSGLLKQYLAKFGKEIFYV